MRDFFYIIVNNASYPNHKNLGKYQMQKLYIHQLETWDKTV